MLLKINPADPVPVYIQIMRQIKHSIIAGELKPGDKITSVRELAKELLINPNTILKAYGELEHEGVVVSKKGFGNFVSEKLAQQTKEERAQLISAACRSLVIDAVQLGLSLEEFLELLKAQYNSIKNGGEK